MNWLPSASVPKLLYRASRDGWNASDFHRTCDGKGATLTVVKSSDGYIFGWETCEASNESFKCHAGLPTVKMNIKNEDLFAISHFSTEGPIFGSAFGPCCDLPIPSNANDPVNPSCISDVGDAYELPDETTDRYFLTGSYKFVIGHYEVFEL